MSAVEPTPATSTAGLRRIDDVVVWPLEGTPSWLLPLWIVSHLGAWAVVIGGPFLLTAVGVIGTGNLRTRTRAALLTLGVGAIAVFLSFHTASGVDMLNWFQD